MSKTPFRILKLKSGEDIVAQLTQNKKDSITVDRPMVMKVMHYVEPMSGMKRNWMMNTTEVFLLNKIKYQAQCHDFRKI